MNTVNPTKITEVFSSVDEFCKQIEQQFKQKAIGEDGKREEIALLKFIRHLE